MEDYQGIPVVFKPEDKLPEEDVRVIVICAGFRCLGYLQDGIWRKNFGDEEMTEVIGWAV